jgi:hypothetical protein
LKEKALRKEFALEEATKWKTNWLTDWLTDWLTECMNEWMNEWLPHFSTCLKILCLVGGHPFSSRCRRHSQFQLANRKTYTHTNTRACVCVMNISKFFIQFLELLRQWLSFVQRTAFKLRIKAAHFRPLLMKKI